ncbi:G- coupled receptor 35-like [Pelobates cultripes]|uniref:G- coupled receptor 35-like n=1 Tax=Pelobates cultripes TaxID=61616 RepID=A0AAD1RAU8_PELCU|nr:G- coupled receptor 35-like [Pelobates cultripes]
MSIFSITAIAVDRYIAIKHPLKFRTWRSPAKAAYTCCALWFLFIAMGVFRILQSRDFTLTTCFQKVTTEPFNMALVFVLVGFTVPLIIISYCSGEVLMLLRKKNASDTCEKKAVRKAFNIIMANLVVFVVCFLPVHVGYTVRFITESLNATCHTWEKHQRQHCLYTDLYYSAWQVCTVSLVRSQAKPTVPTGHEEK